MKATFEDIQQALVDERISIMEFTQILIDNFGYERTAEIIKENVELAKKKENIYENHSIVLNDPPVFVCGPGFSFRK